MPNILDPLSKGRNINDLYKGYFRYSLSCSTALIHFQPLKRGQPLYKGQNGWSQRLLYWRFHCTSDVSLKWSVTTLVHASLFYDYKLLYHLSNKDNCHFKCPLLFCVATSNGHIRKSCCTKYPFLSFHEFCKTND